MTRVYLFDGGGEPLPEESAALLPRWRRERRESLRYPPARQESLGAGLLYAFAMARQGLSPSERVTVLPAGKPVLADRTDVYFSLSHSGRYAMCAVSGQPVGADVQQMREMKLTMARRFHPGERDWLARLTEEERQDAFFRLWTRKEAWVKTVSADRALSLSETDVIHRPPELYFADYTLPHGYRAAVCSRLDDIPAAPVVVTRAELLAGLS